MKSPFKFPSEAVGGEDPATRLYEVSRREPLRWAHKLVHVDRWVVLAESAEAAIAAAKDCQVPPDLREEMAEFLEGTWEAEPVGDSIRSLSSLLLPPTEEEIAVRDASKIRRAQRHAKKEAQ